MAAVILAKQVQIALLIVAVSFPHAIMIGCARRTSLGVRARRIVRGAGIRRATATAPATTANQAVLVQPTAEALVAAGVLLAEPVGRGIVRADHACKTASPAAIVALVVLVHLGQHPAVNGVPTIIAAVRKVVPVAAVVVDPAATEYALVEKIHLPVLQIVAPRAQKRAATVFVVQVKQAPLVQPIARAEVINIAMAYVAMVKARRIAPATVQAAAEVVAVVVRGRLVTTTVPAILENPAVLVRLIVAGVHHRLPVLPKHRIVIQNPPVPRLGMCGVRMLVAATQAAVVAAPLPTCLCIVSRRGSAGWHRQYFVSLSREQRLLILSEEE